METISLYRPTGPNELELVKQNGFKKWPPHLPEQPMFYPVTNEEYTKVRNLNFKYTLNLQEINDQQFEFNEKAYYKIA